MDDAAFVNGEFRREVRLKLWEKFCHFDLAIFWGAIFLFCLILWAMVGFRLLGPKAYMPPVVPVAFGVLTGLCYWLLKRGMAFRRLETGQDAEKNFRLVQAKAIEKGWIIQFSNEGESILARTPRDSAWIWRGERVSIYFEGQVVWVNSIADPALPMTSFANLVRNKWNMDAVADAIGMS